jgi:hypothetical protein
MNYLKAYRALIRIATDEICGIKIKIDPTLKRIERN